ncbi:MAG: lactate utilization protein C [Alphaproteobacteria bacterium]
MSGATGDRATILARVREALGGARAPVDAIRAEAAALVPDPAAVRPAFDTQAVLGHFLLKATSEKVTATAERVADAAALPAAVRRYLDAAGLEPSVAVALPDKFLALDWQGFVLKDAIDRNEPVALTFAEAGIAETGTLVFPSSPTVPTLFNFLALHHLVVLRAADVVPYMEDVWRRFDGTALPRSLNLVTGTSGTADIEGKNVRGAHGPRFMRIFVLEG